MNDDTTLQEALVYTWPLYEMMRMRAATSPLRLPDGRTGPDGQRWCNVFTHARKLLKAGTSRVVTPNNDTLYTNAWLDLSDGPLVMHVPDTAGRYYVLGFLDFFTNPFAHIGQRLTGTQARSFFITGPDWQGEVPAEFAAPGAHIQSPTNWVWVIGRLLVDGEHDIPQVHALQDQFLLQATTGALAPKAFDPVTRPKLPLSGAEFLAQVNLALAHNPVPAADAELLARWAALGMGAGLQPTAAQVAAVDAALPITEALLRKPSSPQSSSPQPTADGAASATPASAAPAEQRQAWTDTPQVIGTFGRNHLQRARVALMYIGMLESAEAMYPIARVDATGARLNGQHRYRLRFVPGQLPPVYAFWSLTMYDSADCMLVANPIDRYAIGDRTPGLQHDADGGLTLHLSHQAPPDAAASANWLPAPAGDFYVCLRAYLPKPEMVAGDYRLPALERVTAM